MKRFIFLYCLLIPVVSIAQFKTFNVQTGFNNLENVDETLPPTTLKFTQTIVDDFFPKKLGFTISGFASFSSTEDIQALHLGVGAGVDLVDLIFTKDDGTEKKKNLDFSILAQLYGWYSYYHVNAGIIGFAIYDNSINIGASLEGRLYLGKFFILGEVGFMPQSNAQIGLGFKF